METSIWVVLIIFGLYLSISDTRGELDKAKKRIVALEKEIELLKGRVK